MRRRARSHRMRIGGSCGARHIQRTLGPSGWRQGRRLSTLFRPLEVQESALATYHCTISNLNREHHVHQIVRRFRREQ